MKQKFLDNQRVEGGIKRYSEKYNVGIDTKSVGGKNNLGKVVGCAVVGIGLVGLMLFTGTPDQDSVERARMYQTSIVQQPDSLNYEGK